MKVPENAREVPLYPLVLEGLRPRLKRPKGTFLFTDPDGRRWDFASLQSQIIEHLTQFGLRNYESLAVLRHTFARNLIQRGVPLPTVYQFLGLSDVGKAMIYSGFLPQDPDQGFPGKIGKPIDGRKGDDYNE
jgi:site-specific recombinase XerD